MEETTTTATPRKRRRLLETFEGRDGGRNNEDDEEEGTPRLHRRPEPPPRIESGTPRLPILSIFPRNRTSLLEQPQPHNNQRLTFIASRIEEKLADLEIESRKDIEQLFQDFSAQLRSSIAKANSSPSNIPPHQKTSQTSQKQSNGTILEMPLK